MTKKEPLERIADALEKLAPQQVKLPDFKANAYIWDGHEFQFTPVEPLQALSLDLFVGIDRARDTLLQNTLQFSKGQAANNALLWGARGMGKSSLVKAVFCSLQDKFPLKLIEIQRGDLSTLPRLMHLIRKSKYQIIIYCDDLSFEYEESIYKSLKAALDGGIAGRPENVLFYASSNRRHLMSRDQIENERATSLHDHEALDEKISLSDRFGIWIGFHSCDQLEFFEMIEKYIAYFDLNIDKQSWKASAVEWSRTRGALSGRVAYQFVLDLKGRLNA